MFHWRLQVQGQGVGRAGFSWGLCPWPAEGLSSVLCPVCVRAASPYQDSSPHPSGLILMPSPLERHLTTVLSAGVGVGLPRTNGWRGIIQAPSPAMPMPAPPPSFGVGGVCVMGGVGIAGRWVEIYRLRLRGKQELCSGSGTAGWPVGASGCNFGCKEGSQEAARGEGLWSSRGDAGSVSPAPPP